MASNPSGAQGPHPPMVGSAVPQGFVPPMPMQFRHLAPQQQPHSFIPAPSPQFRPVGQGLPNMGVPPTQSLQFSQPMQQLPPRPGQPVPSSQPLPYGQLNMPIASSSSQVPQNPQHLSNMPGVGGLGMPLSSSYTFASSYGQPQNTMNPSSQYQPISQMHAAAIPSSGQPWLSSGNQSAPPVAPVQPMAQQPTIAAATVMGTNQLPSSAVQSSDWQEHGSADGRRYYYNKKTRQSSWDKPLELMTPLEISWHPRRKITTGLYAHF